MRGEVNHRPRAVPVTYTHIIINELHIPILHIINISIHLLLWKHGACGGSRTELLAQTQYILTGIDNPIRTVYSHISLPTITLLVLDTQSEALTYGIDEVYVLVTTVEVVKEQFLQYIYTVMLYYINHCFIL